MGWPLSMSAVLSPTPFWRIILALACALLDACARLGPSALRQDGLIVTLQCPFVLLVFFFRRIWPD
jgi:hypothetical protein